MRLLEFLEEFWGGQQTAPVVEEDTVTIKKSEYTAMLEQLVKYQQKELEDQKQVIEKQAKQNHSVSTPSESSISK
jgi:cell division protein FtsB